VKLTNLLMRIRAHGGDVRLDPEDDSRLQFQRGSIKPRQWKVWKKLLIANRYGVIAILREARASAYREASGRDPHWHKTYPYSRTEVGASCQCDALPYAHQHLSPGPAPNVSLDPGETVWDALMTIVTSHKPRKVDSQC
jgi:hypothetical protein